MASLLKEESLSKTPQEEAGHTQGTNYTSGSFNPLRLAPLVDRDSPGPSGHVMTHRPKVELQYERLPVRLLFGVPI